MTFRSGLWPILALAMLVVPAGLPARADYAEASRMACERAIVNGAKLGGVPEAVLHAISLTETGRTANGRLRPWPWAINREGEGSWFATRAEAFAFAQASLAAGRRSFDVGCFQINYNWHGHAFPSLESMFDPEAGARYAAQFLRELYAELGSWPAAAGAYHSRTPEFANKYRARFDRIYAELGGAPLVVTADALEPDPEPAAAPENALPRKSRTKMARGPRIISVPKRTPSGSLAGASQSRTPDLRAEGGREAVDDVLLFVRSEQPAPGAQAF